MIYTNEIEYRECQRRIEIQERKDRKIMAMVLTELFADKVNSFMITNLPKSAYIDLTMTISHKGVQKVYDFEIKERNKDIVKYPTAELKQKKLNEMMAVSNPSNALYYAVLVNQSELFLYDVRAIDWDSLQTVNWNIKKRQMEDGCKSQTELTYIIPISLASYRMDVRHIYNRLKETE